MRRFGPAVLLLLAAVAVYLVWPRTPRGWTVYSRSEYGLAFSYPGGYHIEEQDLGDAQRYHHRIELTEDTEENRAVREGRAPGREGPAATTVDVYQNEPQRQAAGEWIRTSPASNFRFSDRRLVPYPVAGREGVFYVWSGLYEADAVVVATAERLYVFTVTYITPDDAIRRDFYRLLRTVRLR